MAIDIRPTANNTFIKSGVSYSADSLVITESLVLRINFCGNLTAKSVAANL